MSNLISNITYLDLYKYSIIDEDTVETREVCVNIMLLLFYQYRIQSDLLRDYSYWKCYTYAVIHPKISDKGIQVMQHLQDIHYNYSNLKIARNELTTTTTFLHIKMTTD